MKGLYIVFDGLDECGKTTQAMILSKTINAKIISATKGTIISSYIENALNHDILPLTEMLLFSALRNEILHRNILPDLLNGCNIICDRSHFSTIAYQGSKGLDINDIQIIHTMLKSIVEPDIVFLFINQYKKPIDKLANINIKKAKQLFLDQKQDNWIIVPKGSINQVSLFIQNILCKKFL